MCKDMISTTLSLYLSTFHLVALIIKFVCVAMIANDIDLMPTMPVIRHVE